jgi:hypothetical protein
MTTSLGYGHCETTTASTAHEVARGKPDGGGDVSGDGLQTGPAPSLPPTILPVKAHWCGQA